MEPIILDTREGYDRWAKIYDGEGNPLIALEEPIVERWLGSVVGLQILDAGCGTGRHTLRLIQGGADVVGIDFSPGMLAKARAKLGSIPARLLDHDMTRPLPHYDDEFDRVVCGLALDHIKDLPAFFGELRRVCRPGGFIVATVMHPAMMLRGVQARFIEPGGQQEIRPASFRHEISDYVLGALRSGLQIVDACEASPNARLAACVPRAEKYIGWPLLFAMKLGRLEGA